MYTHIDIYNVYTYRYIQCNVNIIIIIFLISVSQVLEMSYDNSSLNSTPS